MASYAALASAMELLEDILHRNHYPAILHRRRQILKSLHQKFTDLRKSLKDYSSKGDEAADLVERRIRDTAYQVQDVIESEIANPKDSEEGNHVFKKIIQNLVLACEAEDDDDLQKVGREVDSIVQELKAIKESQELENLRLGSVAAEVNAPGQTPRADADAMVGFDEYLEAIKEKICGNSAKLQVIPIVGMGGIGKTTLARNAFDNASILERFDFRGWVTISQDYDVIRVLQNIIISLRIMTMEELGRLVKKALDEYEKSKKELEKEKIKSGKAKEGRKKTQQELREEMEERRRLEERTSKTCIYQHLKGRRYLVVIDDVWKKKVWDDLKQAFPDDGNKSRILLTTRLTYVAQYAVGTSKFLYEMEFLKADASWDLLKNKVFGQGRCPNELEDTGRSIAGKCKGLPLAIVVIAGILSSDTTLGYWKMIERNVSSVLRSDDDQLSNILSLSYNHLPSRLKACFLLMGSFPEDYEISIPKLIRLWIAEGFLNSDSDSGNLEERGMEYFKELVERSLVIVNKKKANGEFKFCVIHDLLRDFCTTQGANDHFFNGKDWNESEKVRRIILYSAAPRMPWALKDTKYVNSICLFSRTASSDLLRLKWHSVPLLKIVDVADIKTLVAPTAFSRMFRLKYLALQLGIEKKKHLPSSISKFLNLQTLIIHAPVCESISLPSEIWKMPQLRHLIIDRMNLPAVPEVDDIPLQKLECLQTLETAENFVFTNEAISMIPNIRKLKLICRGGEAGDIWNQYCLNNLVDLLRLEKLNIVFHAEQFSYVDSFQSSFAFPRKLEKLSLQGCRLPWENLTVVGSLPFLQVLRLRNGAMSGNVWAPEENQFVKLNFLVMESLDLKEWIAEHEHFPNLQHLHINKCTELERIPAGIGETLKFISVQFSKRAGESANEIRKEQNDEYANFDLQVHVLD
ncbi:putative late blight resistance protein homolog R1B-17 [Andrographis paniculata]|uniref:putative late blight resistance protein homolog R1B-17 n=1 Tax=Andrographis paniculata TaxID=175694 RepID=UPI0021E7D4D8|nr:putative late blight resistance protein homolog R1B-17 [Andrographis paniculata]